MRSKQKSSGGQNRQSATPSDEELARRAKEQGRGNQASRQKSGNVASAGGGNKQGGHKNRS